MISVDDVVNDLTAVRRRLCAETTDASLCSRDTCLCCLSVRCRQQAWQSRALVLQLSSPAEADSLPVPGVRPTGDVTQADDRSSHQTQAAD